MGKNLFRIAKQKKIKYFLISFVDLFGILRSKLVPTRAINEMSTTFSKETKSVVFLENITDLGNVSSSSVRKSIKNGTKPTVIEELNPLVAKYIEENSLYE